MPHECSLLQGVLYFCPKNIGHYDYLSILTVAYSLVECGSSWHFITKWHNWSILFLHCWTFFAVNCWWNLEHLPWQVTQIDIWSLITFITRHNRFKFSVSSRPLQLDCCDESPGLPSPGSRRCSRACHCIYGLHRTNLHIDTQILQVEIRYSLWDYKHNIVFCYIWCHIVWYKGTNILAKQAACISRVSLLMMVAAYSSTTLVTSTKLQGTTFQRVTFSHHCEKLKTHRITLFMQYSWRVLAY
jgi:hypothetical protein